MISQEYRSIIATIVRNSIKKSFPGLKKDELQQAAMVAARAIHARLYGANVDGVDSPIWGKQCDKSGKFVDRPEPIITATQLLEDEQ